MLYKINNNYFSKWTPAMAYVFGLWCADGNLSIDESKGSYKFTISLKKEDKYLLIMIRKDMKSEHPLQEYYTKSPNSDNYYGGFRLEFSNLQIAKDLLKLGGTPKKSNDITLPKIPDHYFAHFIRGVFDGDGTISYTKHKTAYAGIYSASRIFLEQIQSKLNLLIPEFDCRIKQSRHIFFLYFSPVNIRRFAKFIYDNNSLLFMHRKYEKFLEIENNTNLNFIEMCSNPRTSASIKNNLLTRLKQGQTIQIIAREMGIRKQSITKAFLYFDIDWRQFKDNRTTTRISRQKITSEKLKALTKEELISRLSKGESLTYIAEEFGTASRTIRKYCENYMIDWKILGADKKKEFRRSRFRTLQKDSDIFSGLET